MERERITISIKKPVLDRVDKIIDGVNIRNRSHAFEALALKALSRQEKADAVILLGGDDALNAIPLAEKFLGKIQSNGITEAIVATGFLSSKIKDRLGDGCNYNVKLVYSTEGQGTAGALSILKNNLINTFIVFNCFENINYDLKFLMKYHKEHNAIVTVATKDIDNFDGIYIIEPEIFRYIDNGKFSMLEDDVFPRLIKEGKLIVYPVN